MKFAIWLVATLGAFILACGAFMLTVAVPAAAIPVYLILALASILGFWYWLGDGDIRDGVVGGAMAIGIILAAIAKWRGMVG